MKSAKRWRYYCDHCKKSGGSKYHMERHEKVCTRNPDRSCRMCRYLIDEPTPNLKEMINIVNKGVDDFDWIDGALEKTTEDVLKKLKEITKCPACRLAAICQAKEGEIIQFNYKKEKEEFWRDHAEEPRPWEY